MGFFKREQEQDDSTDVITTTTTTTPSPSPVAAAAAASTTKLSLLVDIALSLGSSPVVSNNDIDGQQENNEDEYDIFLSYSEDVNNDHNYNEYTSSPALKYNIFRDTVATTTA